MIPIEATVGLLNRERSGRTLLRASIRLPLGLELSDLGLPGCEFSFGVGQLRLQSLDFLELLFEKLLQQFELVAQNLRGWAG